ncbi:DUF6191 domain-containing protein, partial [Streptomyces buecherae]|uniref:DUF6191 domain-containing protein n=1 Tax=Streptomyces buecherae TaxID=2763006 RepID=UPI0021C4312F
ITPTPPPDLPQVRSREGQRADTSCRGGSAAAVTGEVTVFNLVDELFAPGRKHAQDERDRLELCVDDIGDGDPGRGPIDLASGRVTIRRAPGPTR